MEVQHAGHEVPPSMPLGSGSGDWRDSRSAPAFQSSLQMSEQLYHVDPSPSSFASPTGSSPSASPQHQERRRNSAGFPLFLAQNTSAAPITIEPSDANGPGWPSSSEIVYSPPSRYNYAPQAGQSVHSMEYLPSPVSTYAFAAPHDFGHFGGAAGGTHRRQLSIPSHPFQNHVSHVYEAANSMYGMMAQEREPYHGAADSAQGRRRFVQEHPEWPPQNYTHLSHYDARSMQPPFLLASTMPTNAPILTEESSLAHSRGAVFHQYDSPSRADLSNHHAFPAQSTEFRSNPPVFPSTFIHRAPEPSEAYIYGTDPRSNTQDSYSTGMDICTQEGASILHEGGSRFTARHSAPNPAQPHLTQEHESINPSPTHEQGRGENVNGFMNNVPMHGAVVSPERGAMEQPGHAEMPSDQHPQYVPAGNHGSADDMQKGAPMVSVSDRSDVGSYTNGIRETPLCSVDPVDNVKQEREESTRRQSNGSEESIQIKRSPCSSPELPSRLDAHANSQSNTPRTIPDSVAVAPLPSPTALESQGDERLQRNDEEGRVNDDGAAQSTNAVYAFNGTATTIKTPETEEAHKVPQTILDGVGGSTSHTISEAVPHNGVHSTINQSNSLPLQATSVIDSATDMQVISPTSYSRGQDLQGYHVPSVYPFTTMHPTYSKSSYNQHLPTVPSLLRPEWRRGSMSEYPSNFQQQGGEGAVPIIARKHSFDYEDNHQARPVQPLHRNSLPNLPLASEPRPPQEIASSHPSPSQAPAYYTPGERLVPAAFGNPSSSHGSGSSASSTPPAVLHDASANVTPIYRYEPTLSSQMPLPAQGTTYDSPRDQKAQYEPAYPAVFNSTAPAPSYPTGSQEGMFYAHYDYNHPAPGYPRHFEHRARGSSSSPAPPMIAGTKRGREEDWAEESEAGRELQRRRSSYSQSTAMLYGGIAYRTPSISGSPSLPSAEMGVIRVAGYVPSLKDMGVRDVTGELPSIERYANGRRPGEDAIRSGSDTSYSFISLPGNTVRKRPRRKFEEITRNYICIWPGCSKAYGTLNHLNAHVTMQKHGVKRVPSEFKELRKVWRKQKREQQHHSHPQQHGIQDDEGSQFFPDEDQENTVEDDEGSVYNPAVDSTQ